MGRRRYGWTEAKIHRFQRAGRGQGEGVDYKPWLTVSDVPSKGRSRRVSCDKTGRQIHLLSDTEYFAYLEQWWDDDVVDIREQFPLPRSDTLAIARRRGVRHPKDTASGAPLVQTTDLLCTLRDGGSRRLRAIAVKVADDLEDKKRAPRIWVKLDLERTFWTVRSVEWSLVTDVEVKTRLGMNLSWLHERRTKVAAPLLTRLSWCERTLAGMASARPSVPISALCLAFDDHHGLDEGTGLWILHGLLRRKAARTDLTVLQIQDAPAGAFSFPGVAP